MKKLLTMILPFIVLSTTAFAIEDKTDFYFKTNIGAASFKDSSLGGPQMDFFRTSIKKEYCYQFWIRSWV